MTARVSNNLFRAALTPAQPPQTRSVRSRRADAQPAVREAKALNVGVDFAVPAEAAAIAGLMIEMFRKGPTTGDHLRLPRLSRPSEAEVRGAIDRVLSVETGTAAESQDAVVKESRAGILIPFKHQHQHQHQ